MTSEKYNEIIKKKEIVEKELVFNTDLDKVKSKARSIINILDDKKEYDKEIKNANSIEKLSAIIDQMIQQYKDQEAKKIKDKKIALLEILKDLDDKKQKDYLTNKVNKITLLSDAKLIEFEIDQTMMLNYKKKIRLAINDIKDQKLREKSNSEFNSNDNKEELKSFLLKLEKLESHESKPVPKPQPNPKPTPETPKTPDDKKPDASDKNKKLTPKTSSNKGIIIGAIVGTLTMLSIIVGALAFWFKKKSKK
ncbi:hypothetical protein [Mycoplasmopsis cynos]|uniref:hypothetical protein n=1 Tax=Mycoplasmopsis cynos TaxID=171284 RepID=UPI0021FF2416|nr:hypothetical protein [Mycoplasmopsis cynos]UWV77776.1 hypothetical protein NW070_02650 [Mycoplasmopsis cynos]